MRNDLATMLYLTVLNTNLPLPIRLAMEMVAGWLDGPIMVDDMEMPTP